MISKLISSIIKLLLLIIIPFVILIRGAVYLHTSSDYLPWVCIAGGTLMGISIVFVYLSFIHQLFVTGGAVMSMKGRLLVSFIIVLFYVAHGIFYMSTANMKSESIKQEIRKVHPILRLAVSTLIHIDKEIIITDADRQPEDYRAMGLKSIKNSLHYKQSTGYSHALDLRTKNRPVWKNFLVQNYFRLMGFRTLRHTGTADHLHVSLMSHDRPSAR